MGYVQEARENHVKKKVEEEQTTLPVHCIRYLLNYAFRIFKVYYKDANNHSSKTPALRSKMKQKALKECDQYTSKYAECALGRTMSVVWKCRSQAKELNECLHQFTNDSVLEEMKKQYMLQEEGNRSMSL